MAVREGILALLEAEPKHGYQVRAEFEASTAGLWTLNSGQVYTTIDRLVRDGFVEPSEDSGDDARQLLYTLTEAGRTELAQWWNTVATDDPAPRDELVLKVLLAIRTDATATKKHALRVITTQRAALFASLQERRKLAAQRKRDATNSASDDLANDLALDSLLVRAESDLRWLDLCEARLTPKGKR